MRNAWVFKYYKLYKQHFKHVVVVKKSAADYSNRRVYVNQVHIGGMQSKLACQIVSFFSHHTRIVLNDN